MTAQIYDFRSNPTATKRWSDMDRYNKLKNQPVEMPSDVDPFDAAFYRVPEKDPA